MERLNYYEYTLIIRPDLAMSDVEKIISRLSEVVKNTGGSVLHHVNHGIKEIKYEMKKNKRAYYIMLAIRANSTALQELQRISGISGDILKSVAIKVDAPSVAPMINFETESKYKSNEQTGE